MEPVKFDGANKIYKAPEGWDEEKDGVCGELYVFEGSDKFGHTVIVSAWKPTQEELKKLNEGEPLYLQILMPVQPPVSIFVDNIFKQTNNAKKSSTDGQGEINSKPSKD